MGVDFDVAEFCRKLRGSEAPYKCPVDKCDKVYQSVVGMSYHLLKHDHNNPHSNEDTSSPIGSVRTPQQKVSTPKPRSSIKSGEISLNNILSLVFFFIAKQFFMFKLFYLNFFNTRPQEKKCPQSSFVEECC